MYKTFWKSKRFWGSLGAIVGCVGDIVQQGPSGTNIGALLMALFGLYGGIVGSGPLTLTDANAKAADAVVVDHIVSHPATAQADPSAALAVTTATKP